MTPGTSSHRHRGNGHGSSASFVRTLDDLAELSSRELHAAFSDATVPESLTVLDGDLVGRMLAIEHLERGRLFRIVTAAARSPRFPWIGKTFKSIDADHGRGDNRIRIVRTRRVVPFSTRFGISAVDGKPCVVLDYRAPFHDELREVSRGLFLGPACLKRRGSVAGTSQTTVDGSAAGGTSQTMVDGSAAGGTSQSTTTVLVWFALERSNRPNRDDAAS